jgi:DNA primase
LQVLIKYGHAVFCYADAESKEAITVGDYILEEIEHDNLMFYNSTHVFMLEEYKNHHKQEDFIAERFFLYHPKGEISMLTADLIAEKYTLSKIHSKIKKPETESKLLEELVPRVIFEFKNCLILDMIKQKLLELKAANDSKDIELYNKILQDWDRLEVAKKQLSKQLGERIIIKL